MDSLVLSNIAHRPARTAVSVLGIAIGVLLIVFTVGLAHGVLRERGRRESNLHAEIMIRASGTLGLTGSQPFSLPVSRVREIAERTVMQHTEMLPTCGCDHPFAVVLVKENGDGVGFEIGGVQGACCARKRDMVQQVLQRTAPARGAFAA